MKHFFTFRVSAERVAKGVVGVVDLIALFWLGLTLFVIAEGEVWLFVLVALVYAVADLYPDYKKWRDAKASLAAEQPYCAECGANFNDLVFDAYADWKPLEETFEVSEVSGRAMCQVCEWPRSIEWRKPK